MEKHTPGPWESSEVPPMSAIAISRIGKMPHGQLFSSGFDGELTDEDRANARLVAAAPELLGVVKLLSIFAKDASGLDFKEDRTISWISAVTAHADALVARVEG